MQSQRHRLWNPVSGKADLFIQQWREFYKPFSSTQAAFRSFDITWSSLIDQARLGLLTATVARPSDKLQGDSSLDLVGLIFLHIVIVSVHM